MKKVDLIVNLFKLMLYMTWYVNGLVISRTEITRMDGDAEMSRSIKLIEGSNCGLDVGTLDQSNPREKHHALQKRQGCEKVDYTWVGFHGSCSIHQSSLETKLRIPEAIDYVKSLGNDRFYTTEDLYSAGKYGEIACAIEYESIESFPIMCSIFLHSSKLAELRKSYIPQYFRLSSSEEAISLLGSESNIRMWESIIFANIDPKRMDYPRSSETLRFAKSYPGTQRPLDPPTLQAAWPKSVLNHMRAYCKPVVDFVAEDGFISYRELVLNATDPLKEVNPMWGSVRGSEFLLADLEYRAAVIQG
ncbi:hypothetical protein BKA69DRAFT_1085395 [Paraphysoderma sedebokerense]|nr:hypothetical protein BKA69DRAFT_1085395 [Paraphysoderma sedebokerense]